MDCESSPPVAAKPSATTTTTTTACSKAPVEKLPDDETLEDAAGTILKATLVHLLEQVIARRQGELGRIRAMLRTREIVDDVCHYYTFPKGSSTPATFANVSSFFVDRFGDFIGGRWQNGMVELLFETNAIDDINCKTACGRTPLHLACVTECNDSVSSRVQQSKELKALHFVSFRGGFLVASLLLKKGACVDATENEQSWTPLHIACMGGGFETGMLLLHGGADPNALDRKGLTPLHYAVREDHANIVRLLLEDGKTDVNARISSKAECKPAKVLSGYTPLHLAVRSNSVDAARVLLRHGADPNAKRSGWTPLSLAVETGNRNMTKLLLKHKADVNATDNCGSAPLHVVCKRGDHTTAEILLDSNANINAKDDKQMTPLHVACKRFLRATVKLLLDRGAAVNASDAQWRTPLHVAVGMGFETIARLLLDREADPNAPDDKRRTPLHIACMKDKYSTAGLLLDRKANPNALDAKRKTPLHIACESGSYSNVDLLLRRGALVNTADAQWRTPLHVAIENDLFDVARLLLEHAADLNALDDRRRTPLHIACLTANDVVAKLLLKHKANPNAIDVSHKTPLHFACAKNNRKLAKLLLNHKADLHAVDFQSETPLQIACGEGRAQIVEALVVAASRALGCANSFAKNAKPLCVAIEKGHFDIADFLLRNGACQDDPDFHGLQRVSINGIEEYLAAERVFLGRHLLHSHLSLRISKIRWTEAISKSNPNLVQCLTSEAEKLDLHFYRTEFDDDPEEARLVTECLRLLLLNRSIQNMRVRLLEFDNEAKDEAVFSALFELFWNNDRLQRLEVNEDCSETPSSFEDVAVDFGRGFCGNGNPKKLVVKWATQLWFSPLAMYMRESNCSLVELTLAEQDDFGGDEDVFEEGLALLCSALSVNTSVRKLNLENNYGAAVAEKALIKHLYDMKGLHVFRRWYYDSEYEDEEVEKPDEIVTQEDVDCICLRNKSVPLIVFGKESLWPYILARVHNGGKNDKLTMWRRSAAYAILRRASSLFVLHRTNKRKIPYVPVSPAACDYHQDEGDALASNADRKISAKGRRYATWEEYTMVGRMTS